MSIVIFLELNPSYFKKWRKQSKGYIDWSVVNKYATGQLVLVIGWHTTIAYSVSLHRLVTL